MRTLLHPLNQDERHLLSLRKVRPGRAPRILAWIIGAALLLGGLFLALAPWQQTAPGSGRVIAYAPLDRQQNIEATVDGRVARYHVREGSRVRAGDMLVEIADLDEGLVTRLQAERQAVVDRLGAAQARVAAIEARVESLEGSRGAAVSAAGARARMAVERARAAAEALRAAEAALVTARLNYDRQAALVARGLAATRALELAELERVRGQTEVDRAKAALSAAQSEEVALRTDQTRAGTDGAAQLGDARAGRAAALSEVAAATAELARLDVRLQRQAAQVIRAPRDGTVLRLVGGQGGEIVKSGEPLIVLVPETDARAVELWVQGQDAPLIARGRPVRLHFEGWPALNFTGWPQLGAGMFNGRVALVDVTDNGKGAFRVLVEPLPGEAWPPGPLLRQGVRVNGWVQLGRVRLGYELWRQFNGFPPMPGSAEPQPEGKGSKESK